MQSAISYYPTPLSCLLSCNYIGLITVLFNFSFFRVSGQGIELDHCDIEWFALEQTEIILYL